MKIISYNLGYGRGHDGSLRDYLLKAHRFLHQDVGIQKQVLDPVLELIVAEQPDLFAYAEGTTGSFRNRNFDQHQYLVDSHGAVVSGAATSKYGESSFLRRAPFHAGNSNGVISFCEADIKEHYLRRSRKKLVYEVTLDGLTVFTVHLPLVGHHRRAHLMELAEIINEREGDIVVCGDFNLLGGLDELDLLTHQTALRVAGEGEPTFPSHKPSYQLDVFLYRFADSKICPQLRTVDLALSDHLPVLLEW